MFKKILKIIIFLLCMETIIMANNKILFIVGEPYSGGLTKAIKEISLKNKDKKINEIISFYVRKNFSQITPKVLSNYNVFCIDTMYPSTEKIIKLIPKNKKIYSLREPNGGAYTTLNNRLIFDENIIKYRIIIFSKSSLSVFYDRS